MLYLPIPFRRRDRSAHTVPHRNNHLLNSLLCLSLNCVDLGANRNANLLSIQHSNLLILDKFRWQNRMHYQKCASTFTIVSTCFLHFDYHILFFVVVCLCTFGCYFLFYLFGCSEDIQDYYWLYYGVCYWVLWKDTKY